MQPTTSIEAEPRLAAVGAEELRKAFVRRRRA
jgi:hypothetical protein